MLAQVTLKRCPTLKQHDFLKLTDISNQYNHFRTCVIIYIASKTQQVIWLKISRIFILLFARGRYKAKYFLRIIVVLLTLLVFTRFYLKTMY